MADLKACDICGTVEDPKALPPNVEPIQVRDAVANYDSVLCNDCKSTKSLSEIIEHSTAGPGGTVDGADKLPYLVQP